MKKIFKIALALASVLTMASHALAYACPTEMRPFIIEMRKGPDYIPEPDEEGQRSSIAPISCTITPNGIDIPGVPSDDICLYEIYDEDGVLIASLASEQQFISYVYHTEYTIEIRLYTSEYVLYGYMYQ